MEAVYAKLAKHLDNLPAGFPATESGVELRILKRLFTPGEAEVATRLTMMPEPPAAVAERMSADPEAMAETLESMAKKGLIFRMSRDGNKMYSAAQFVVGIWEYHVNDLDPDLIRDVNEYLPHLMDHTWARQPTKQMRVIPVTKSVSAPMSVMGYEAAEEIIRSQSKIVVAPCICRREHQIVGDGCGKLEEACLVFGGGAYYYEENSLGRSIDQQEALDILHKGMEEGLVLQPGNSQKPMNICMCCGDCCQILRNLNRMEEPAKVVSSNYYAKVEADNCNACGLCEDRCQMAAIEMDDIAARVKTERCIGCGLCVAACEFDAMRLVEKPDAEKFVPPKNTVHTYMNMAKERGLI